MKNSRNKAHLRRRSKTAEAKHWLGEGAAGQESLFLELDPALYTVDGALSALSSSIAHRRISCGERSFAVFVPPEETAGWQLGYLCKKHNVYLQRGDGHSFLEEAAERFGAKIIDGLAGTEREHSIDLFVFTDYRWSSRGDFVSAVCGAREIVSPSGLACFVLCGFSESGSNYVSWEAEAASPFRASLTSFFPKLEEPSFLHSVSSSGFDPLERDYVNAFLRRNRDFFGRGSREMLEQRLSDPDFQNFFMPQEGKTRLVFLAAWPGI